MDRTQARLLLDTLVDPERLLELPPAAQTRVLRQARVTGLLGRLACRIQRLGLLERCPGKLREHLQAAGIFAAEHERMVLWEVHHILRALRATGIEPIFLKGAAYALAGLEVACGRLLSDVDILVTEGQLGRVEEALRSHGWEPMKMDEYDQSYYRNWMHELPPMRHRQRNTVVDIHHTIVPLTSRLRPDPGALIGSSLALGNGRWRILCPTDTVLHKVVHLFHDGALDNALRELVDLDGLLRAYGAEDGFLDALVPRAQQLGLLRPCFYGLRYARRLLRTPIPAWVEQAAQAGRPPVPVRMSMDVLVTAVLVPADPDASTSAGRVLAGWLLYIRSHWLRMPPLLLARHLLIKAFRRAT